MVTTVPKYENRKTYAGRREMSGGTDYSVCLDFSRVSKRHTGAGAIGTPSNKIMAGPPLVPPLHPRCGAMWLRAFSGSGTSRSVSLKLRVCSKRSTWLGNVRSSFCVCKTVKRFHYNGKVVLLKRKSGFSKSDLRRVGSTETSYSSCSTHLRSNRLVLLNHTSGFSKSYVWF